MNTSRFATASAAALVLALALAGCTQAEPGPDPNDDDAWRNSPLAQYLSAGYPDSDEEWDEKLRVEHDAREKLVAECMSKQGFDYVPVPAFSNDSVGYGDDVEWEPESREFVERYGYGAVKSPWDEADEDRAPGEDEFQDPNRDTYEALSDAEKTAWDEAMYGPQPTEEEMDDPNFVWEGGGCTDEAYEATAPEQEVWELEEFEPLMERLDAWQSEGVTAGLAEIDREWAACMTGKNYGPFQKQSEAAMSIYDKADALWRDAGPEGELSDADRDAVFAEEVPVALADLECREETNYRKREMDAYWKAEQQFVDQNKAELERFKAALEGAA